MTDLGNATKILQAGGIVIFPTDTAYGIGCRMDDEKAVRRLFKLRNRPVSQATPVLVDSIEMALRYILSPLPNNVRQLMELYWPGALTIICSCIVKRVPLLVRGSGKTIGVRMPNHKMVLTLIKNVGVPILGPSANFHGKETPYTYNQIDSQLIRLVDFVVKGECKLRNVSTVVDYSVLPPKILRHGAIQIESIEKLNSQVSLSIDTSNNQIIILELTTAGKKNRWEQPVENFSSQLLLPSIVALFRKNYIKITDITDIKVNMGPGSYTGIRVGVAVACALGWMLQIPVNGKKKYSLSPIYTRNN